MNAISLCLMLAATLAEPAAPVGLPQVLDPRLEIRLFAAEPDIVTPCGIAVDARGRVLVVESHTHFRPEGYQGPATDRIRLFEDTNGDGRADRIETYFEGTTWTMNVGVHPDGSVYVATRGEIFRLRDTNDDGRADERTQIAYLDTAGDYPHNGLSGFAFDFAGNVYFGLGENKGAEFRLIGTDGSVASELEGGQVYRCRADGTKLEMLALGYWNPFHVALDAFGRLLTVDNDPDSLPPCRLLHVVPGGNYGYRYRNGRRGVHPFTAWNGELPGTLPMVAGTGEAPSGIVVYESDHLPADYVGDVLGTSWGDHRIERFHLERRGASFRADARPIIKGDENFRPVGIAVGPSGALYVSDWVLKDYNVHGKGRVWQITARQPVANSRPTAPAEAIHAAHAPLRDQAARQLAADAGAGRDALKQLAAGDSSPRVRAAALAALAGVNQTETVRAAALADPSVDVRTAAVRLLEAGRVPAELLAPGQPAEVRAEAMRKTNDPQLAAKLWAVVNDPDAFLAQAAREGLARMRAVDPMRISSLEPPQRLAALLILREARVPGGKQALRGLLRDADSAVRFAAIQWVGEERLTEFRSDLEAALTAGPATGRLFGGYLAALERLDGKVREPHDEWAGEQYIVKALEDPKTSPEVVRWCLRMLRADHPLLSLDKLRGYLASSDGRLQLEAVRTLRDNTDPQRTTLLMEIAADEGRSSRLRAEAIVGIDGNQEQGRALLVRLASSPQSEVREEALRSLRGSSLDGTQRATLEKLATDLPETRELIDRVLEPGKSAPRPVAGDVNGWLNLAFGGDGGRQADARAGERIFFHAKSANCGRCHQVAGRGGRIGPELTITTGALSRQRLIESIVQPDREIAPQFATWLVVTTAGKSHLGILVKELATGEQTYADTNGQLFEFKPAEIESRQVQTKSIMPDGLPQLMTVQELRDLMAFLQSAEASL